MILLAKFFVFELCALSIHIRIGSDLNIYSKSYIKLLVNNCIYFIDIPFTI